MKSRILMCFIVFVIVFNSTEVYARSEKELKMTIYSVSKKQIKIKFINKGNSRKGYSAQGFKLYKRKKGRWIAVKRVSKTPKHLCYVKAGASKRETIVWKKHYKKNLTKGRYKIKWYCDGCNRDFKNRYFTI